MLFTFEEGTDNSDVPPREPVDWSGEVEGVGIIRDTCND